MKIRHMVLAVALGAIALPASAEIIFPYGAADTMTHYSFGGTTMPTLVMVPGDTISPQVAYQMQRARAWSNYRRGDHATHGALVLAPSVVSYGVYAGNGASSYGQAVARTHLSRATAYRLGYYK